MLRLMLITTLAIGCALAEASVPKGATEIEPGVFKHTDTKGKTFLYRKTPFGVVKSAEHTANADAGSAAVTKPAPKQEAGAGSAASPFGDVNQSSKPQDIKVVERGEVLEFERSSPFGVYKWKNKKSELTPEETAAWARAKGQQAPAKTAGPKE